MKKRDKYWLIRLLQSLIIVLIFLFISLFNIIQFNHSYMEEEQEELQVFTRQIEWAVFPYLKNKDFETIKKYTNDFKDEDIVIRIFDADKKLIAASKPDITNDILSDNKSVLFPAKENKWEIYKHSIKNKMIGDVKEINADNTKYYLEITIAEDDVIGTIVKCQMTLMVFFGICILILLWGLLEVFYRTKKTFNGFEDSVIKIANGELDTPIDVPNLELLEELSISVKKMTTRLKNQIQRLTQLEEYKSDFLQNITHEIKTPITAINSAIELIENNNAITNNDKECFEIIRFQIKSINKLVNDILALSEIEVAKTEETKHFEKFNINSMVEKTVSNFSHLPIEINFIQNTNEEFYGNEELLSTALSNLLTNAIRYSCSDKIDIILDKKDGEIKLSVKDYGVGIEQRHFEHIFERFYRIDKARSRQNGGSGLGLAIVKNIVELHNGQVIVESELNKGTVFTIILPEGV